MAVDTQLQFGATLVDSEGISATTTAHVFGDGAQTLTQTKAALAAWAGAMDLITGAQILETRARILGPGVTNGAKPVAGSEVQETATFDFLLGTSGYHYGEVVPAILETLTGAGVTIDPTNTDVAAFINLMLAAVLGGHYTGANQTALSSFYRSFQSDRKHRRQVFRRTVNYTPQTAP